MRTPGDGRSQAIRTAAFVMAALAIGSCETVPASSRHIGTTSTASISPNASNSSCQLPVALPQGRVAGQPVGMLDPRSGALSDEHLAFIFDDALGLFRSVDEPALYGVKTDRGFVTSFDRAFNRWLPVPSAQISRDGSHYFYITAVHAAQQQPFPVDYVFHIVDVRTGGDRTLTLRQQTFQDPGYAP